MLPTPMMASAMTADSSRHHAGRSSLVCLQHSFTSVISSSISPSHANCQKILNRTKSNSFMFIKFIEKYNDIKPRLIQIFGIAARSLGSLSLLTKEMAYRRSISTMDPSWSFSLCSDHLLKYKNLLVENIAPHSCYGGGRSSDSAYRSQNSRGDGNSAGGKKRKAQHRINTGEFGEANGDDQNQDPGGTRRALYTDDLEAIDETLACPFQKFDPTRYNKCSGFTLRNWHRVLQHIKRNHLLSGEYCPSCRMEFKGSNAEDDKNEHIRGGCQPTTAIETGRLLQEEYNDLTRVGPGDQVTKWFKGWAILFHGHLKPRSPFAETLLKINSDHTRGRLLEIVQLFTRGRETYLTDEDLMILGGLIIDDVQRGRLCIPPGQVLQLTPAHPSTGFDTMADPVECVVPAGSHVPVPLFDSSLAIVPSMSLSLPESQAPPVIHCSIPGMTYCEPLESSIQPPTNILDFSDQIAVFQPPMFQLDTSSYEQGPDNILQQPLNASTFQQSVDPWTQDPNDSPERYFNFSDYPVPQDGIEDVIDFTEDGVPI